MSIEKYDGMYELICDNCGESAEDNFYEFQETVDYKKNINNGWKSKKLSGEWVDICPECANEK